jgi:diacylglycerol kinase
MCIKKLADSFKYAGQGLKATYIKERNFRVHCMAVVAVVVAGVIFGISFVEWAVVILTSGFVISAEMANTAIEKLVDMITKEYSEDAKLVKDISAGFVLVAAIAAAVVGIFIFAKYFLRLLGV